MAHGEKTPLGEQAAPTEGDAAVDEAISAAEDAIAALKAGTTAVQATRLDKAAADELVAAFEGSHVWVLQGPPSTGDAEQEQRAGETHVVYMLARTRPGSD
jgi:hypothetical protein